MKKLVLFLGASACLSVMALEMANIEVSAAPAAPTSLTAQWQAKSVVSGTKTLTSIPNPTWLTNVNTSRGVDHDQQDIGLMIKAGSTIKVRQTNAKFTKTIKLNLLNDSAANETSASVSSSWTTIKVDHDSVPFFVTPKDQDGATIEYEISGETLTLPTFKKGGNQKTFFQTWQEKGAPFALIQADRCQFLVPAYAKKNLEQMADFSNLTEFLTYYDGIFDFYDKEIGLDGSAPYNQPVEQRYFLKEDGNTGSGAYYGTNYAACRAGNFENIWLKRNAWGTLHEIAHGYQTAYDGYIPMANDRGACMDEVTNNLLVIHYLRAHTQGTDAFDNGWLYDGGKKDQWNQNMINIFRNAATFDDSYDKYPSDSLFRSQLIALTMLDQKAGDLALTHAYQDYRKAVAEGMKVTDSRRYIDHTLEKYSESAKLDFTPVLQAWGTPIDRKAAKTTFAKNYRPTAYLADVVPDNQLQKMSDLLEKTGKISGFYMVVDNDEIKSLGMTGDVTVQVDLADTNLDGQTVKLKDGTKVVAETKFTRNVAQFTNIPNGIYSIEYPSELKNKVLTNYYAYVKNANNEVLVQEDQTYRFRFQNRWSWSMGYVNVDLAANELIFDKISEFDADYSLGTSQFVGLKVLRDGKTIYNRGIKGSSAYDIFGDKVPIQLNDVLVFERDSSVKMVSDIPDLFDTKTTTHYLRVTTDGLKKIANANDGAAKKLTVSANPVRVPIGFPNGGSKDWKPSATELKTWVKNVAIDGVKTNNYQVKLKNVPNNTVPVDTATKTSYTLEVSAAGLNQTVEVNYEVYDTNPVEKPLSYVFDFKGYSNKEFAKLNYELGQTQATLETMAVEPHYNFPNQVYASVKVSDSQGKEIFKREYIGDKTNAAQKQQIPMAIGNYITVTHKEPNGGNGRLSIQETTKSKQLEKGTEITYQVTDKGLVKATLPKEEKSLNYVFDFKGYNNQEFAKLNYELGQTQATLETMAVEPHYNFPNQVYASVKVNDSKGKEIFKREYIGDKTNTAQKQQIPMSVGNYITVTHKEPNESVGRLSIQETTKGTQLEKGTEITYQVTEKGLVKATLPKEEEKPLSYVFDFKGLSDAEFAKLSYELGQTQATLETKAGQPHYYFANQVYASIKVSDSQGKETFKRDYIGDQKNAAQVQQIPMAIGNYITVTHKEPNGGNGRLSIQETTKGKQLEKGTEITYQVTDKGLVKATNPEVSKKVVTAEAKPVTVPVGYANGMWQVTANDLNQWVKNVKVDGKAASAYQVTLLNVQDNKISTITARTENYTVRVTIDGDSVDVKVPVTIQQVGNAYQFYLLGIADYNSAQLSVDLGKGQLAFAKTNSRIPHEYFPGEVYYGVRVYSQNKLVFEKMVDGDLKGVFKENTALKENDLIEIYHAEPKNRFVMDGKDIINHARTTNTWIVKKGQLEKVDFISDKQYQVQFKGISDVLFASFDLDLSAGTLALTQYKNNGPHYYFDEVYASLVVKNRSGQQTYKKEFVGTEKYKDLKEKVAIHEGDEVTIYHQEPNGGDAPGRLVIQDMNSENLLKKDKQQTYLVTNKGLVLK